MRRNSTGSGGKKLAQSVVVQKNNLKKLLTPENLAKLSVESQTRLLALLPTVDVVDNRLSNGALSHEYFSHSCVDFKDRLMSGELNAFGQEKVGQNSFKPSWDPWKVKHFEEFWGEKLEIADSDGELGSDDSSADERPIANLLRRKSASKPSTNLTPKKRGRKPKRTRWNRGETGKPLSRQRKNPEIPAVSRPLSRQRKNQEILESPAVSRPLSRQQRKNPEIPAASRQPQLPKVRVKREISREKPLWSTSHLSSNQPSTSNSAQNFRPKLELNGGELSDSTSSQQSYTHAGVNETRVVSVSPLKMRIRLNGGVAKQPCIVAPSSCLSAGISSPPDFPGFTEESLRESACNPEKIVQTGAKMPQNSTPHPPEKIVQTGAKRSFNQLLATPTTSTVDQLLKRPRWSTDYIRPSGKTEVIRVAPARPKSHVYGAKVNVNASRSQLSMNSRIQSDSQPPLATINSRQISPAKLNFNGAAAEQSDTGEKLNGSDVELITVE